MADYDPADVSPSAARSRSAVLYEIMGEVRAVDDGK
jgi:hypothetical protein